MGKPRWISNTRQSMQRLGFCKAVLAYSEVANSSSQMAKILRQKLGDPRLAVGDRQEIRGLAERQTVTAAPNQDAVILQDWHVSRHPSGTGWLSSGGFLEYVESLPQAIGLTTSVMSPTDLGLVVTRILMSEDQRQAFESPSVTNPLVLSIEEQVFFLYVLLEADGDFLMPFAGALLREYSDSSFSYLEAGGLVPDVLQNMRFRFSGSASSMADRAVLRDVDKTAATITQNIKDESHHRGSGSRREQTTIPRLEWLVDVGILERTAPSVRQWRFTQAGNRLAELIGRYDTTLRRSYPEKAIRLILDRSFYGAAHDLYHRSASAVLEPSSFARFVWPAYSKLTTADTYCLLRPLILGANTMGFDGGQYLEYEKAVDLLEAYFQADPDTVQYTINRNNTDKQLKFRAAKH